MACMGIIIGIMGTAGIMAGNKGIIIPGIMGIMPGIIIPGIIIPPGMTGDAVSSAAFSSGFSVTSIWGASVRFSVKRQSWHKKSR